MQRLAITKIPGRPDIELPAYYEEFAWYYPNCELQTKAWFVKNALPDWNYIDCGANIGYYSILFSQLSPNGQVHSIEPTATAEMMARNLAHNNIANVNIYNVAVGRYCGRRNEKVFRLWGNMPDEREYEFITIDRFVEQQAITKLDCIKIDVDSFDFDVLIGAEKTLAMFDPWLVVELNHALSVRGQSNMEALAWLTARGYQRCLVLDNDNFIMKQSSQEVQFATNRCIQLNFIDNDNSQ